MFKECNKLKLGLWQCPPFLFLLMGIVTIVAMIATYVLASDRVDEPQIAALIVMGVAIFIFTIGNLVVNSFNRIAEANHIKSEFIYIISHQLRSPLTVLKWTTNMINTRLKKTSAYSPIEDYLYTLQSSVENLIRLSNSLLEVNRIDAGTFAPRIDSFNLEILTKNIINIFSKYAEASNKKIEMGEMADRPQVSGDKERTALVIQNLLDNAIRYTPGSGDIIIRIEPVNTFLKFSIKDEGMGIPLEKQNNIFQKFFRTEEAMDVQPHGTGIGLYISKAIIEASGGQIGFSSAENKGSIFWFTLPIAK